MSGPETPFSLYLDAFCGLVCPFPRLMAARANPGTWPREEVLAMEEQERQYNKKRMESAVRFYQVSQIYQDFDVYNLQGFESK